MRILFVSYYLPPLLYPQSIQIGRFLAYLKEEKDLEITVLTAEENSHLDSILYPDVFENLPVIKIKNRSNIYLNYIKNHFLYFVYQKPDVFSSWMDRAYKHMIRHYEANDFDLILTFSSPLSSNILGKRLKEFFSCHWIAHNSDPWVDNPHAHFKPRMRPINQELEETCFAGADRIVFTSLETGDFYKNKYPLFKEKIHHIDHSFDNALYPDEERNNTKPIFRYLGSFYGSRSPEPLLKAIALLPEEIRQKFTVELVGGGKKADIMVQASGLENVFVRRSVSYLESLALMKNADLLLVIDAPSTETSLFFPSKLADYIGARKPILGIAPDGASQRIIHSLGFRCHDTSDTAAIAESIRDFMQWTYPKKAAVPLNAYDIRSNICRLKTLIPKNRHNITGNVQ